MTGGQYWALSVSGYSPHAGFPRARYTALYTAHYVLYTAHSVHCTLNTVDATLHCTLHYSVQYIVHTSLYTALPGTPDNTLAGRCSLVAEGSCQKHSSVHCTQHYSLNSLYTVASSLGWFSSPALSTQCHTTSSRTVGSHC